MKQATPFVLALAVGLGVAAQARHTVNAPFKQGTPVAIVGQVTSAPKKVAGVVQKHFQIALGPSKADIYTLHINDAALAGLNGEKIAPSDLDDKQWVRAEGSIMDDPHRIKVDRLEVIAQDTVSVKKTKYFRTGFDRGYIDAIKP
jgi:uncharacterized lipoprotein YbaY